MQLAINHGKMRYTCTGMAQRFLFTDRMPSMVDTFKFIDLNVTMDQAQPNFYNSPHASVA